MDKRPGLLFLQNAELWVAVREKQGDVWAWTRFSEGLKWLFSTALEGPSLGAAHVAAETPPLLTQTGNYLFFLLFYLRWKCLMYFNVSCGLEVLVLVSNIRAVVHNQPSPTPWG